MFDYDVLATQITKSRNQDDLDLVFRGGCLGLFKTRLPLFTQPNIGSSWVKHLSSEDRQVFSWIGRAHAEFGKLGGKARARTARRIPKGCKGAGRFTND